MINALISGGLGGLVVVFVGASTSDWLLACACGIALASLLQQLLRIATALEAIK